ncbi:hypothetical protein PAMC26577_37960 [Caballeronia sordidicola]|uniref:Uncharacterized protein n=1 Tax=Caballeronia sordidicola TaxID=196367 RepID=A0A242M6X1_CABSO|nr:hypothetical protein PAMC26577_37960 [Caballeronia sordidicola]
MGRVVTISSIAQNMATKGGTDNAVMLSMQVRQVAPSIDVK